MPGTMHLAMGPKQPPSRPSSRAQSHKEHRNPVRSHQPSSTANNDDTADNDEQKPPRSDTDESRPTSYRDSLPGAPRPVCSENLDDDDSILEFISDMMMADHTHQKTAPAPTPALTPAPAPASGATAPRPSLLPPPTKTAPADSLPPALPQKSALRASRALSAFDMDKVVTAKAPAATPLAMVVQATPHDVYLSSEEDASSSADDSECYSSGTDEPAKSPAEQRRWSHRHTARVVSVVFSGKPSVVDLSSRRSPSPSSLIEVAASPRPLGRTATESSTDSVSSSLSSSSFSPPASTSSASSASTSSSSSSSRRVSSSSLSGGHPRHHHPSGMPSPLLPPSMSLPSFPSRRPNFLSIDPFATTRDEPEENPRPRTPTAMFKRTLSLVRKRSRPFLNGPPVHVHVIAEPGARDLAGLQTEASLVERTDEDDEESGTALHSAASLPQTPFEILHRSPGRKSKSSTSTPASSAAPSPSRNRILSSFTSRRRSSMRIG